MAGANPPDTGFAVRGPAGFYMIYPSKDTAQALLDKVKEKGVEIVEMEVVREEHPRLRSVIHNLQRCIDDPMRSVYAECPKQWLEDAVAILNSMKKETP